MENIKIEWVFEYDLKIIKNLDIYKKIKKNLERNTLF